MVEQTAGIVGKGVRDGIGSVCIGGQGSDADRGSNYCIFTDRIGGSVTVSYRTNGRFIDIRDIDGKRLTAGAGVRGLVARTVTE